MKPENSHNRPIVYPTSDDSQRLGACAAPHTGYGGCFLSSRPASPSAWSLASARRWMFRSPAFPAVRQRAGIVIFRRRGPRLCDRGRSICPSPSGRDPSSSRRWFAVFTGRFPFGGEQPGEGGDVRRGHARPGRSPVPPPGMVERMCAPGADTFTQRPRFENAARPPARSERKRSETTRAHHPARNEVRHCPRGDALSFVSSRYGKGTTLMASATMVPFPPVRRATSTDQLSPASMS